MKHLLSLRSLVLIGLFLISFSYQAIAQCPGFPASDGTVTSGISTSSGLCAPRSVRITYSFGLVSPAPNDGKQFAVFFIWNDGQAPAATQINLSPGSTSYSVFADRTFPVASDCQYDVNIIVAHDGFTCNGFLQVQSVNSWRTDAFNGGNIALAPSTIDYCPGQNISQLFTDVSVWNCMRNSISTTPSKPSNPNEQDRWVQIVYNTKTTPGPRIPNVSVGGVPVTDASGNDIINNYQDPSGVTVYSSPVIAGSANRISKLITATGGFGAGFPATGQIFEVTIRNWSFCNKYDDPLIPGPPADLINGDNPPVTSIALINIIATPPVPGNVDVILCNGTSLTTPTVQNFSVTGTTGSTAINWYKALPANAGNKVTNPNGTNSTTFPASSFPGGIVTTTPGNYVMYATQIGSANACESNAVAVTLTIREALSLASNPGASVASTCRGATDVTFIYPSGGAVAPPTQTFGGATKYTWSVPTGWSITSGQGTATMLARPNGSPSSGTNTISVVWEYASGLACTSTAKTVNVTILDGPAITAQPVNRTICEGSAASAFAVTATGAGLTFQWQEKVPAGVFTNISNGGAYSITSTATTSSLVVTPPNGTYNGNQYQVIVSGTCASPVTSSAVTLTVNTKPAITVNPAAATACNGTAATFSVTATGTGISYVWKRDNGGGPVTITAGLDGPGSYANFNTSTLTVNAVTAMDGYDYSVVVSGTCTPAATSGTANLVVKTITTTVNGAATSTGSICTGNNFALTGLETAINPATVASRIWTGTLGGVPQSNATVQSWFGGSPTSTLSPTFNVAATGTYVLTLTSTQSGVPACTSVATVTITVSQVNTAPTPNPVTVCAGANVTISGNPSGGNNNYTGGHLWTGTGAAFLSSTTVQNPVFNDAFASGAAGGSYSLTYKVTDTNGCSGTSAAIPVTVNPAPNVSTGLDKNICSSVAGGLTVTNTGVPIAAANYNFTRVVAGGLTAVGVPSVMPGAGKAGNYAVADTYKNVTNASLGVTYTVSGVGANSCVGPSKNIVVTVDPEPDFNSTTPAFCSNVAFGLDLNSNKKGTSIAATSYNIVSITPAVGLTNTAATPAVVGNGQANTALQNEKWQNRTAGALTVTYTITPVSAVPCTAFTNFTITVTINPEPDFNSSTPTVCSNVVLGIDMAANKKGTSVAALAATGYNIISIVPAVGLTNTAGTPATVGANKPNTALQNEKWQNRTAGPLHVIYTIRPSSAVPCAAIGNDFTIDVTVNPEPDFNSTTLTVCSSATAVGVNLTSLQKVTSVAAGATGYNIISISGGLTAIAGTPVVGAGKGNMEIADDVWKNTTNAPVHVIYTIRPSSAFPCAAIGNDFTVDVTVNPEPDFNSTTPAFCSNVAFGLDLNSNKKGTSIAATSYNIVSITPAVGLTNTAATPAVVGNGQANTALQNEKWQNRTANPLTVTYTITPVSAVPCTAFTNFTITVTINPEPDFNSSTPTVCSNVVLGIDMAANKKGTSVAALAATGYNIISIVPAVGLTNTAGTPATVGANKPNTALQNEKWQNRTAGPLHVIYTIRPSSAVPCAAIGNDFTIDVTVNPEPDFSSVTKTICSQTLVGVDLAASQKGTSIAAANYTIVSITNAAGLTAVGGSPVTGANKPNTEIMDDQWKNTTGAVAHIIYTVTPVSAFPCASIGNNFTVDITVNPEPVLATPQTKTICSGDAVNYTVLLNPAGLPANSVFSWLPPTMSDASANGSLNAGTTTPLISDVLVNSSNTSPITATYTIDVQGPASLGSCPSLAPAASRQVVITVNPVPAIETVIGTATVCQSTNPVIYSITNFNSLDNSTSYSWKIGSASFNRLSGGGGAVPGGSFGPFVASEGILVLNFPTIATGLIEVQKKNSFGCVSPTNPLNVTVVTAPVAQVISADPAPYCFNQTNVKFFIASPNGTSTYNWSVSGAGTISGSSVGTVISVNMGIGPSATISVTETNTAGCTTPYTPLIVPLNPIPDFTASSNSPICSGVSVDISLSETTGTSGTVFNWTIQNNPGAVGGAVAGGPIGPFVNPTPQHIIQSLNNPTNTSQIVTYRITPTSGAGCDGAFKDVNITVNPIPTISVNSSAVPLCSGSSTNIELFNPNSVPGTTFSWIIQSNPGGVTGAIPGGGLVAGQAITQALTNPTAVPQTVKYRITPAAGGCNGVFTDVDVVVQPNPVLTTPAPQSICNGTALNFTPTITGFTDYSWTSSIVGTINPVTVTGSGTTPITDTPINTGTSPATVTYRIIPFYSGCAGTFKDFVVTVNPVPSLSSSLTPAGICSGSTFTYTPTSAVSGATYAWTRATVVGITQPGTSGTAGVSELLTNSTSSPINVTYVYTTTANSCSNTPQNVVVAVNPIPVLSSSLTPPAICSGTTFSYIATSATPGATFTWTRATVVGITQPGASSSGNVSETLTNTTTAPINVTYAYTTTANGCSTPPQNVVVTVNPIPVLGSTLFPVAICSGATFNYTPTSSTSGATFAWSRALVAGITEAASSGTTPVSETLTNTTTFAINVTYAYVTSANGCSSPTQNVVVTVNPMPVLSSSLTPPAICSATTFSYTPTSLTPGATFAWSRALVGGISQAASAGSGSVSETLTNTTTAPVNVTYAFITTANTCSSTPQNVVVTVNPIPVLSSSLTPPAICSGSAFTYTATSATAGATFAWSRALVAGISQAASNGTGNISETLTNTTTASINVTYAYVTTANGCSNVAQNVVVAVNPIPTLSSTLTPLGICSATTFTYTPTSATSGATFAWSRALVAGISQAANSGTGAISETLTNTTTSPINVTYVVTVTASSCVSTPQNVVVAVNPIPTLSSSLTPPAICSAITFSYTPTSATPGATFAWTRALVAGITQAASSGSGNVSETLTNTTTAPINVTYAFTTSANGCSNAPQNVVVVVNPIPVLSSSLTPPAICSGATFAYTAASLTSGSTFAWSRALVAGISQGAASGTGNVSEVLTNTTAAPINVTYVYVTTANGCSNAPQNVVVVVNPIPSLTSTLTPAAICSAATFTYTPTSATSGATFPWTRAAVVGISQGASSGTGPISEVLTNTTTAPINVTYAFNTSANSCSNPQNVVVVVNPTPVLSSTLSPAAICSAATFNYTPTSATTGATFAWSRAAVVGISQGATSGTSFVSEVLTNTTTAPINVTYAYTTTANSCSGPVQNVVVTVNPIPTLNSSLSPPAICSTATFNYTPTSATTGATFAWSRALVAGISQAANSGSGSISETLTNTTTAPVSVTYVIVTTANSCVGAPQNVIVTVNPRPTLSSTLSPSAICSTTTFTYTPTSATSGATFAWTRAAVVGISQGATSGSAGVSEVLTNTTTAPINVTYVYTTTANSCSNSPQNVVVTVNPIPALSSTLLPPGICSATVFSYTPTSATAGATFTWSRAVVVGISQSASSGSGNISETLTNTTTAPINVTYAVTTTANGCVSAPVNVVVAVNPIPVLSSTLTPSAICSATVFSYTATSATLGATFAWSRALVVGISQAANSGTGNVSETLTNTTTAPISVTYAYITTANSCSSTVQNVVVVVNPIPVLSSSLTPPAICSTATFSYTPTSATAGATFAWSRAAVGGITQGASSGTGSVNEGLTNTTTAPINVTYSFITTANSCSNSPQNVVVVVNPTPVLNSSLTPPAICSGSTFAYTATSLTSGATFAWSRSFLLGISEGPNSGTGNVSETLTNTTAAPISVTYVYITTANGCSSAPQNVNVIVNPIPGLNSTLTPPAICGGNTFSYTASSATAGATFAWSRAVVAGISQGAASGSGNISEALTNTTSAPVNVTYVYVTTANSCVSAPQNVVVTVNPPPSLSSTLTPPTICSGSTFNYTATSATTGASFAWSRAAVVGISQAASAGAGNVSEVLTNTTTAAINVTYVYITSANGCNSLPQNVVVSVSPVAVMNPVTSVVVCSGGAVGPITFSSSLDPGVTYNWINDNPAINLAASGIGPISFTAASNTGSVPLIANISVSGSASSCPGATTNFTITVNPQPVLQTATYPDICSTNANTSNPVNIVLGTNGTSVNVASTGYQLLLLQYSTGGPFSSSLPPGFVRNGGVAAGTFGDINLVKNDTYTNTSGGQVTVRYTIQGTSAANCKSVAQSYDVVVNPQPHFDPSAAPLCSGIASGIVLTATPVTSPGISQYVLKTVVLGGALTAAGTNASPGIYNSGNFLAADKFVNTGNTPANVTYTIAAISSAVPGCTGPDQTVVFTVNPAPGMPNLDTKACSGAISNIVLADNFPISEAAVSYDINSITIAGGMTPGGSNATTGNTTNFNILKNDVFTNSTNVTNTVTYAVVPVASTGCKGPSTNIVLTIEPTVVAAPINHKASICSTSTTTSDATDIELLSPTVPSAGPITFNYTASASPLGSVTGFVPAQSSLAAGFHITDNLINNTNAVATVTYMIRAAASGASGGAGCIGVAVPVVVTVEPKPKMTATPSTKTVCEGVSPNIALSSTTVPSGGVLVEFLLVSAVSTNTGGVVSNISPAGTVFANNSTLTDTYSSTSTVMETVTYTFRPRMASGAGCTGEDVVVNVNVNPLPNITASGVPVAICSGDQFNILISSDVANTVSSWPTPTTSPTAGSVTGASAGAGDQIFQVLFNKTSPLVQTVTYNVTPQASGCVGTALPITIQVNPVPNVLGTATTTVCNGATMNVPLSSKVTSGVTFAWTVDDTSGIGAPGAFDGSGNTINQLFTNTTGAQASLTYTIVPTLAAPGTTTGSCVGDSKIMFVTVAPQISASFLNSPSPDYICKGSTEYLVFNFGGQAPFDFTYTRDQLSPVATTTATLLNKGPVVVIQDVPPVATQYTYTITSVTSHVNGVSCTVPFNVPFVVNVGDTDPTFTIISPLATCSPNRVSFQYNQVAGTIYTWRFGDTGDSTYTATTTVPNMVIKHTYTNLSPTATLNYPVSMQTELPSPYPGCFKSNAPQTVTIYPNIIPNVISDKTSICSGESIQFMNQSVGATSQTWTYRVQGQTAETAMGTSTNINFAFTNSTVANPLIYEVIYRGNNGHCPTPDQIIPIQVYRSAVAGFNEGTLPPVVSGHALVNFTNTTVPIDATAFTYDWAFGADSHIGGGPAPASYSGTTPPTVDYTRPGTKDVVLTVTNTMNALCKYTFTKTINMQLLPLVAAFTVTPTESCAPTKISVATVTATGDEFSWNVIDSNGRIVASSTGIQPTFNISTEGNYLITFKTSSSLDGQVAFAPNQTVKVYAKPFASFDARPDVVYIPDTELSTFNFSSGSNKFAWDFGDGTVVDDAHPPLSGDIIEPKHTYKVEGTYDIMLYAKFDHGNNVVCSDTLSHKVVAKQGGITKVPNAFTPNPAGPSGGVAGNGSFNDVFLPIVKGVEEFNMQIYDRWGNLIFESNSSQVGWDGYDKNGRLMPSGVYVYKLTLRLSDGQRSTQIGDVTMIR